MYEVRLKAGHPTGTYRRAGMEFSASAPTQIDKVPDAVKKDPWLIVSEVKDEKPAGKEEGGKGKK